MLTVAGWGRQGPSEQSLAMILKKVTVPRVDNVACRKDLLGIAVNEFCVGWENGTYTNVCHGDSGSPVIKASKGETVKQVAVVSRGHKNCPPNKHHAVFLPIELIKDWVQQHVNCSKPGYWANYNHDSPETNDGDTEIPMGVCGGRTPLCLDYEIADTKFCTKNNKECVNKQSVNFNKTLGLTCVNSEQGVISGMVGWQMKITRCNCCDYLVKYKCPW